MSDPFHAVKIAAIQHTLEKYGLAVKPGLLGRTARALFSNANITPSTTTWGKVKNFGRMTLDLARDMTLGSPISMGGEINQLRKQVGTPRALGQYWKNYYWTKPKSIEEGILPALNLASTTSDLYGAATEKDPNLRRGDLASAVTGIAAAPFTYRLGIPGQMLHTALTQGARGLVQKNPPAYTPPQ